MANIDNYMESRQDGADKFEAMDEADFEDQESSDIAEQPDGIKVIVLRKPILFEGEKIEKLILDLDSLTARDFMRCEKEVKLRTKGQFIASLDHSREYQACIAAKAAGIKADLIFDLYGLDYTKVCRAVFNFLFSGDSSDDQVNEEV